MLDARCSCMVRMRKGCSKQFARSSGNRQPLVTRLSFFGWDGATPTPASCMSHLGEGCCRTCRCRLIRSSRAHQHKDRSADLAALDAQEGVVTATDSMPPAHTRSETACPSRGLSLTSIHQINTRAPMTSRRRRGGWRRRNGGPRLGFRRRAPALRAHARMIVLRTKNSNPPKAEAWEGVRR
jgi:hypothetical protein